MVSRAKPWQRILVFAAANETGGTALLYHILNTTKYPLFIYYLSRFTAEGMLACKFLPKDENFKKALERTNSEIKYRQFLTIRYSTDKSHPHKYFPRAYGRTHGARPISYIFLNGHPSFGETPKSDELTSDRNVRISKYWAPWEGTLDRYPHRDGTNPFDYQSPYMTLMGFVPKMFNFLSTHMNLVRTDGEGTVVIKSPTTGAVGHILSKGLRRNLVNPTAASLELAVIALRNNMVRELSKEPGPASPWPERRNLLGVGDVFARSLIKLYRQFTPYQNIILNSCVHMADDIDSCVRLLIHPDRAKLQLESFTPLEMRSADTSYPGDVDLAPGQPVEPEGMVRRVYYSPLPPGAPVTNQEMIKIAEKKFSNFHEPLNIRTVYPMSEPSDCIGSTMYAPITAPPYTEKVKKPSLFKDSHGQFPAVPNGGKDPTGIPQGQ